MYRDNSFLLSYVCTIQTILLTDIMCEREILELLTIENVCHAKGNERVVVQGRSDTLRKDIKIKTIVIVR